MMSSIVRRPSLTAVSSRGSIVSSPGNPGGGASESFSDTACGANEREGGRDGQRMEGEKAEEGEREGRREGDKKGENGTEVHRT